MMLYQCKKCGAEILIELGLRAEVGGDGSNQYQKKSNGEIISPLHPQQNQALAKPKTTKAGGFV